MATTYTMRPDGLANVDVGGGRVLAMPEAHAQAGGATLAPAAPMPELPAPNPHTMIGSGESVAGPGGGGEETYVDVYGNSHRKNAPPSGFENAVGEAWRSAAAPPQTTGAAGIALEKRDSPGTDIYGNPLRAAPAAAPEQSAPAAAPAGESPAGLTRINPGSAQPQLSPQASYFGAAAAAPGRIVQTSKGGDQRVSFIRKPGETLAPGVAEYADSLDPADITNKRETATTNAAIARDNAVSAEIDAIKNAEGELEAQRSQVAQNRAALQQKLDIVDQREREAMNSTPQTRREVLQSRGALAGVMSGLSIALGGYVQGLRGGENPGLKILNDSIESEISSQRAKWEASKDKIGMARTDFGQAMQLYGDPNMAEADMRMRALTLAANMAGTYKAQGENQEWLANQQQVTQQLAAQAAGEKQKWKTLAEGQVVQENYAYKAPTFAQVGGPPKLDKGQEERKEKAAKRLVRAPDGTYGYVSNDNRLKDVQDKLTSGGDVVEGMGKILALAQDNTLTPGVKRDRYKALVQDIRPVISVAKGQGAMGEQEQKGYEDLLGDPSAVLRDNGAILRAAIEQQKSRNNRVLRDNVFKDPDSTIPFSEAAASTFKPGLK